MLHLRTFFLMAFAALLLGACGGSSEPEMTAASAASTGGMAKAMGTTTVGSWTVTSTNLPLITGGTFAGARAINDKGQVVGTANDATYAIQRVIWDLSQGNAIVGQLPNYDPASTAEPASINFSGEVAGTERISSTLREGVYWSKTSSGSYTAVGLPPLPGGSRIQITARGINVKGVVSGSALDSGGLLKAVTWSPGATAPVAIVSSGEGVGISDAGHVAGAYTFGSLTRAFLWRDGNVIDLNAAGGSTASARALAINNTGKVAGTSDGNTIAVVWSYDPFNAGSPPTLAKLPLTSDLAQPTPAAINDNGDVVGTASTSSFNGTRAVLWRNGQLIPLASFNSKAFGINSSGQIVGEGDFYGDGRTLAILWTVTSGTTTTPSTPVAGNTAPSATISMNTTSLRIGDTLNVAGSFKDPDQGPWTYTVDWGDGAPQTTGFVSTAGTVNASHVYSVATKKGYTVVFKVTDAAGASGSASKAVKVSR